MWNVAELFLIGDRVDLAVDLEHLGLEVKKLTRSTLGENNSNQEGLHDLQSQEHMKNGTRRGRSLVNG